MHENWLAERGEDFRSGIQIATLDPFQGQQERLSEAFTQMRRISVSKSPTAAPSKCARSSTKPHPPKANARRLVSSSVYQPVPSPKSLAWAGPYASGRMHSTSTSIPAEPATHPTEAINEHYRTGQTHRQRLPQPHQPPTPNAPHHRRPRRLHPHPTLKSPITSCGHTSKPPNSNSDNYNLTH